MAGKDLSAFIDMEPFWVIWQVVQPARGGKNRIRRIHQNYATEARAQADAERYRRSGAVTWVEEARPLVPSQVPAEALDALNDITVPAPRLGMTVIDGAAELPDPLTLRHI